MKHIMVFNNNSEDDRDDLRRMSRAKDLCMALWDIQEVIRKYNNKTYDSPETDKVMEDLNRELYDIMDEYDVNKALEGL